MHVVLSIGGSDSCAGAGIQSDLKTFLSLGTYGCTAITAVTAQNTRAVTEIAEVDPRLVTAQISAVLSDLPVKAIKIGMVYSKAIIEAISNSLTRSRIPIVLDPILNAGTGAALLQTDGMETLIQKLLPICTLITPNKYEAEILSGKKIRTIQDVRSAATAIMHRGARNVIIKGGHTQGKDAIDVLLESDGTERIMANPRISIKESHGSGCNFSAAVVAFIARGLSLSQSCLLAGQFVRDALEGASRLGRGHLINIPLKFANNAADRYLVLERLQNAVDQVVNLHKFYLLIPETQCNFGFALPAAESLMDIAAVSGRIVRAGLKAIQTSRVAFGASTHVGSAILTRMMYDPSMRSAMNIKFEPRLIKAAKAKFSIAKYDRKKEPDDSQRREGSTIRWGISTVLQSNDKADIIYHTGGRGKEPMIMVFGKDPFDVVVKIKAMIRSL